MMPTVQDACFLTTSRPPEFAVQIDLVVIKAELFSTHVEPTAWPGKENGTCIELVVITVGLSVHTEPTSWPSKKRTGLGLT